MNFRAWFLRFQPRSIIELPFPLVQLFNLSKNRSYHLQSEHSKGRTVVNSDDLLLLPLNYLDRHGMGGWWVGIGGYVNRTAFSKDTYLKLELQVVVSHLLRILKTTNSFVPLQELCRPVTALLLFKCMWYAVHWHLLSTMFVFPFIKSSGDIWLFCSAGGFLHDQSVGCCLDNTVSIRTGNCSGRRASEGHLACFSVQL